MKTLPACFFLAIAMTGSLLAQNDPKPVRLKKVTGEEWDGILCMAISADGKTVAASTFGGGVFSWDAKTEAVRKHPNQIRKAWAVAISGDGKYVVSYANSGQNDGVLTLSTASDGKLVRGSPCTAAESLAFSPEGALIALNSRYSLTLLRRDTLKDVSTVFYDPFKEPGQMILWEDCAIGPVGFSSDGKRLAGGASLTGLKVWDIKTMKEVRAIGTPPEPTDPKHQVHLHGLALNATGKLLATCGDDGLVKVWEVDTIDKPKTFTPEGGPKGHLYNVAFHPKKDLVFASGHGGIRCWNLKTGEEVWKGESDYEEQFMALNRDGTMMAVSLRKGFSLYEMKDEKK